MKQLLTILLLACAWNGNAQVNLVLNPSFEQYSNCPTGPDQIKYANYWTPIDTFDGDPVCSPEYCNACAGTNGFGVPLGWAYYQYPRTGNGMALMEMFLNTPDPYYYPRDYLQGRLSQPLIAGVTYCVTFYVVLIEASGYANNKIGAYLDDGSIDIGKDSAGCAQVLTAITPQIVEDTIIHDTLNWTKVQGSFTAIGGERFITIGNFSDYAHTLFDTLNNPGNDFDWYLIDDVSVIESSTIANAGPDVSIQAGDTTHIGLDTSAGVPYYWYVLTDTGLQLIPTGVGTGSGGTIAVHPDTTTTYVVAMELCSAITYDTVKVTVGPVGIGNIKNLERVQVYPSPSVSVLHIDNAQGCQAVLLDMVGQEVLQTTIVSSKQTMDIHQFRSGVYILQLTGSDESKRSIRIIKQ